MKDKTGKRLEKEYREALEGLYSILSEDLERCTLLWANALERGDKTMASEYSYMANQLRGMLQTAAKKSIMNKGSDIDL